MITCRVGFPCNLRCLIQRIWYHLRQLEQYRSMSELIEYTPLQSLMQCLSRSYHHCQHCTTNISLVLFPHLDKTFLDVYAPLAEEVRYRVCIRFRIVKEYYFRWS